MRSSGTRCASRLAKLRYALDFLGSLRLPEALHELTEALVQAQELGQMNDRVSAQHLLATAPQAGAERCRWCWVRSWCSPPPTCRWC